MTLGSKDNPKGESYVIAILTATSRGQYAADLHISHTTTLRASQTVQLWQTCLIYCFYQCIISIQTAKNEDWL